MLTESIGIKAYLNKNRRRVAKSCRQQNSSKKFKMPKG